MSALQIYNLAIRPMKCLYPAHLVRFHPSSMLEQLLEAIHSIVIEFVKIILDCIPKGLILALLMLKKILANNRLPKNEKGGCVPCYTNILL